MYTMHAQNYEFRQNVWRKYRKRNDFVRPSLFYRAFGDLIFVKIRRRITLTHSSSNLNCANFKLLIVHPSTSVNPMGETHIFSRNKRKLSALDTFFTLFLERNTHFFGAQLRKHKCQKYYTA